MKNIGKYLAIHVNKLYAGVTRNLTIPHEFICVTDDPTGVECRTIPLWDKCRELGGCYNRLYVFSEDMRELIGERFVCIDLDSVVVGNLDELFSRDDDFVINKFYNLAFPRQFYNGGLFMMNAGARKEVWEQFAADTPKAMKEIAYGNQRRELLGTDQAWISHVLGRGESLFTKDPEDGVMTYKRLSGTLTNGRELPEYARIVFFAGKQDPTTEYMKSEWIREHWDGVNGAKHKTQDCKEITAKHDRITLQIKRSFVRNGYVPDLYNPQSLSEKLLHKKLFMQDPRMVLLADKVRVYEYLVEKLGKKKADELWIEKLVVTNDPETIEWATLPKNFICKGNNGSGMLEVVQNGIFNRNDLRRKMKRWLDADYGTKTHELYYNDINPLVLIEPLLLDKEGRFPIDYKFHMLNGEVGCIQVISGRGVEIARSHYDERWNFIDVWSRAKTIPVEKPKTLRSMISVAKKLSAGLDYVRVDLYEIDDKVKFGELTFFPHAGNMGFVPMSFDFELGKKLKLSHVND